jgi:DNA-binding NtrC family response regulator
LIDDDADFSEMLRDELQQLRHEVVCRELGEDGLRQLESGDNVDLVLLDNLMPRMSGLEFLAALRRRGLDVPVILMTSAHNDRTAIQATNLGAFGYAIKPGVGKPLPGKELESLIEEAVKVTRPPMRVPLPGPDARHRQDDSVIIGKGPQVRAMLRQIGEVLELNEPVLILGETGTGKDLVARAIHTNSSRQNKRFVPINCPALPEALLESELFGHEEGAFTGAKLRKGLLEHADGGTVFLDEVGDMPPALQAKLLRVLENREVLRIGRNDPIKVDVRVLAATHRDLNGLVREGKFREDLYHRLAWFVITVPPLRDREGDVELLARHFLGRLLGGNGSAPALAPATLEVLRNYKWPGNIRQLQKVLCRAAASPSVRRRAEILPGDLDFREPDPVPFAGPADEAGALAGLRRAIAWAWDSKQADLWPLLERRLEEELLRHAVARHEGSEVQLAKLLGIARNTLRDRLQKYGLQLPGRGGPS